MKKNQTITKSNFIVLTGGPGSGKTSIIDALSNKGFKCIAEVGRGIIREQLENGGSALPWDDKERYSALMLSKSIDDFIDNKHSDELCFFDRGIPDSLGYTKLIELKRNQEYIEATKKYRYNPTVYILPPWREIYETDSERKQDFAEAIRTYKTMKETYTNAGYQLIDVPSATIAERTEFILNDIKNRNKSF